MRFFRLALIFLPVWLPLLILPFLLSEKLDCIAGNWRMGYLWQPDFSSDVIVSGDDRARRIDFTKLKQFSNVCVVQMYTYGQPYSFRLTGGDAFRDGGPRACWRDDEGKVTIVGIDAAGDPKWAQLTVDASRNWYRAVGEQCAEPNVAVLNCVGEICSFGRR